MTKIANGAIRYDRWGWPNPSLAVSVSRGCWGFAIFSRLELAISGGCYLFPGFLIYRKR